MAKSPKNEIYWRERFKVTDEEGLAVQTRIEEQGEPLTLEAITRMVVQQQLADEAAANSGTYVPHEQYAPGQKLTFPALHDAKGEVVSVRQGNNPRYGQFDVIAVRFDAGEPLREFLSGSAGFQLRSVDNNGTLALSEEEVLSRFGDFITERVRAAIEDSGEYLSWGDAWLPAPLLVPVHEGHLNIAEAMIDMVGAPLGSDELLPELDLDSAVPEATRLFSLNYALSRDPRFRNAGSESDPRWEINH